MQDITIQTNGVNGVPNVWIDDKPITNIVDAHFDWNTYDPSEPTPYRRLQVTHLVKRGEHDIIEETITHRTITDTHVTN